MREVFRRAERRPQTPLKGVMNSDSLVTLLAMHRLCCEALAASKSLVMPGENESSYRAAVKANSITSASLSEQEQQALKRTMRLKS